MKTDADKKLDEAREHVQKAIEAMSVVITDQYKLAEFRDSFRLKLRRALASLLDVREEIQ